MFDLIQSGPRHQPTAAPVVLSIVGHVVILTAVVVVPLLYATDSMPAIPSMMAFVADAATPPPPPPPPPPPATAQAAPEVKAPPPEAFAAPVEAPSEVTPEQAGMVMSAGEGGVEGGIVGGVMGGIVGGLIAAEPPPPPPPPPPPAPDPVRVGGNVQAPKLVKRVEPVYPEVALVAQVTGFVILEAVVGSDGAVESVRVLRSVKLLDQAAVDAVKQWRYEPLMLNGHPTPFVLSVTISFSVRQS